MTLESVEFHKEKERVIWECIKQLTTQHYKPFLQQIYNYVISECDDYIRYMKDYHPETIFVLETIKDVYKYIVVPELGEAEVTELTVNEQEYVDTIQGWVLDRLNGILSGIDTDFVTVLSGEKYEKKSVKTMNLVILPSYEHLKSIRGSVRFHKENRVQLDNDKAHAVRKQLNMAGDGALAVCKKNSNNRFETIGLIPSKHVKEYPRFRFHENMEWDFCVPGNGNSSRVRYFRSMYMIPVVSLEEEMSQEVKAFLKDEGNQDAIRSIIETANECDSGSILIFAKKEIIKRECQVLIGDNKRGTLFDKAIRLDGRNGPQQLKRFINIDGALMIDFDGVCHACGVILDGIISRESEGSQLHQGEASRGSRYNSTALYVNSAYAAYKDKPCGGKIMGLVKSDDGMLDLLFPNSR